MFFTIDEHAARWHRGKRSIAKELAGGALEAVKIGQRTLVTAAEVARYETALPKATYGDRRRAANAHQPNAAVTALPATEAAAPAVP